MKKRVMQVPVGVLAALIVLMAGAGAGIGGGCGGSDGEGPTERGAWSPPAIDRLAPSIFETASFGFG